MSENADKKGLARRIWRSIFRKPIVPRDDTDRKWVMVNALIFHFRPLRLPREAAKYAHTWGLGGMSAVLFLLLASTGVLLMFVYEPSPGRAYDSIVSLETAVVFGGLIRNIHHWSANFLIIVVLLHLLRVFLTGAFYAPRQFNWVLGLALLFCVLTSNFTGYLLPWDQLSYWAITIVTGMLGYIPFVGDWLQGVVRGGPDVSSATLIYFYAAHTTVVPVIVVVLMAFHFWRVRKARGVVVPRSPGAEPEQNPEMVLSMPNLLLREFAVALALVAFVMVFSLLFDAPLGDAANPGMSPNPAKAPWYFLGFQELLLHSHPLFAIVVFPLLVTFGLLLIPYVKYDVDTSGIFLMSHAGRRLALGAALCALALTPLLIVVDEWVIDLGAWLPGVPIAISNGLLPAGIILMALAGFYLFVKKRYTASNNEAVQTLFVLLAVVLIVLTVTGIWFRGAGMALVWPWNV